VTRDSAGNIWGTDPGGETQNGYYFGVVYKIDTSGDQSVLYAFCSHDLCEGTVSSGVTFDTAGNFYVTTSTGPGGAGILYRLDQAGNGTHPYQFLGQADGADPTEG
jgi:sugar lactone lactonase YvrE